MKCNNCGKLSNDEYAFCPYCGTKKEKEETKEIEVLPEEKLENKKTEEDNTNVKEKSENLEEKIVKEEKIEKPIKTEKLNSKNNEEKKAKKRKLIIIIAVIAAIILAIVVLLFSIISSSSNKLKCKSPEGNITIMYNEEEIIGYKSSNITYDLDKQKEYAKHIGINAYIDEFNNWFINNTTGSCTKNGEEILNNTHDNEQTEINNYGAESSVVGNKKFGFVTVPKNWIAYKEDNTALKYSYAGIYIVTLDYIKEKSDATAKEYAQSYLRNKKQSQEASGATGTTVRIGKNKEYIAYQVYMYYPSDGKYIATYWFETEDGVIRYLSLEGPTELNGVKITDYLHIPESYSLNK